MLTTRLNTRPATALVATALTGALLLGACGGGGDDDDTSTATVAPVESSTTTAAPLEAEVWAIDQTIWYAGFAVTLGDAELTTDGDLTVAADFENRGSETASFSDVVVTIESDGETYELDASSSELPSVPGDSTNDGVLAFAVEEGFTFADAVLTVGNPDNNQAVVPLGDEGELVTNEPVEIASTDAVTAGDFTVTLTGGQILFDDPITHRAVREGHTIVHLDLDLTRTGGSVATNFSGSENLSLRLPDGTGVAVMTDGHSDPIELVEPDATIKDLYARFEGNIPYEGDYTLVLTRTTDSETFTGEVTFTVAKA